MATGRLSRWTRYFTVASAFSLVVSQAVALLGGPRSLVGYAVQFFAVTSGHFRGASDRGVGAVIAALTGGTLVRAIGLLIGVDSVSRAGAGLALCGAVAYTYLVGRRFFGG